MSPIYYCANDCARHELVSSSKGKPEFGEVSFSSKSNFVLLTNEYQGEDAEICQTGSAKPVMAFDRSARVNWLPDDFQF